MHENHNFPHDAQRASFLRQAAAKSAIILTAAAGMVGLTEKLAVNPDSAAAHATVVANTDQAHLAAQDLGPGAWCWFEDPRAIHDNDKKHHINEIVEGHVNNHGDVIITSVDSAGQEKQADIGHISRDDHDTPSLSVEPDGRITAYYSGHNGNKIDYRTTLNPGDITSWGPYEAITANSPGKQGFTYPKPVILSAESNRHYNFWRGGSWEPTYTTRTENGKWTAAREFINAPGNRPYVKVATNGRDRIGFAFTDGHPDNNNTSIYFMQYKRGQLYTAGGQYLGHLDGNPIQPSGAEVVYDFNAHQARSWVQDTAFDKNERPVIGYTVYPPGKSGEYWYAYFNGRQWERHYMADTGPPIQGNERHYDGGMDIYQANPNVVYLSRKIGRNYQVEKWVTGNHGHTWHHEQVTHGSESNVRPVVAQELPGTTTSSDSPAALFTARGEYNTYMNYFTHINMFSGVFKALDISRTLNLKRYKGTHAAPDATTADAAPMQNPGPAGD